MEQIVIIVLIVAAIAVAGIFQHRATLARRKALEQWAVSNGLDYSPTKVYGLDDDYSSFDCLRQGSNRYGYNIMQGKISSRPFLGFDYHYQVTTHTGKTTQTHHYNFSAIIVESPFLLKPLFIRPENIFDKLGEFVGLDDIDFESAQFSSQFYVKSPDKKWAYDIIHQGMMEYLLASPRFSIQFDLKNIIIWRSGKFEPEDFRVATDMVNGILGRIPQYVIDQQKI
ncbi:MAG: hypothetical protein A2Y07_03770 [Planctomycetes bacterium GWF2_50_10]|nr:MAG: hypothetical protein A2Y07_03770 [Planctomycetes bacterium GWF2_50_10]